MQLSRPLCFFDLESTGLDRQNDRIVEIAIVKIFPDQSIEEYHQYINPGIPIPEESTAIHGVSNDMVADKPTFDLVAPVILNFIDGCDLAGYNSNSFDLPMLYFHFLAEGIEWDYHAIKKIDPGTIFKRKEERTLSAAYKFYCGKTLENAHSALADTRATAEVFFAQLQKHPDLPNDISEMELYTNYDRPFLDLSGKFSLDHNGTIIFNFGQYKGEPALSNIDYLLWMQSKNFASDTMNIVNALLSGND